MNARLVSAALVAALTLTCSMLSAAPRVPPAKPTPVGGGGIISDAARLDRLPDLQVIRFSATGPLETRSDGTHALPVTLTVKNAGTASADRFKISARATVGGIQHFAGLFVSGSPDASHAWVSGPLAAGAEVVLRGQIVMSSTIYGSPVVITLIADSTVEDEFIPVYGRVRESNEDNNISAGLSVNIPVPVAAAGAPAHPAGSVPVSSEETWQMGVSRLTVNRKTESSGDDPYFIVVGFRARLFQPRSASAFWGGSLREIASDLEHGSVTIPSSMGTVTFPHVRRLTRAEFASGTFPEVVGAVVLAMDHDNTPWGDVREIGERLRAAVQREAESLIAQGHLDLAHPDRSIKAAIDRVKRELEPGLGESIRLTFDSIFDTDEQIGVATMAFVAVDRELADSLHSTTGGGELPRLKTTSGTVTLTGDGGSWSVIEFAGKDRGVVP